MQPRVVERSWKCETKSDEVHVFSSFLFFTQLDTAQSRRRTRVQSILFNILSELARRLIPPGSAKTTLLAARLPNERRSNVWSRQIVREPISKALDLVRRLA
jgi:hypothetical protein